MFMAFYKYFDDVEVKKIVIKNIEVYNIEFFSEFCFKFIKDYDNN